MYGVYWMMNGDQVLMYDGWLMLAAGCWMMYDFGYECRMMDAARYVAVDV